MACGALAQHATAAAERHGWPLDVHAVNPLLHNRPERIVDVVAALWEELAPRYERVVVGYADCGSYGAVDAFCAAHGLERLPGLHCYDLYAGAETLRRTLEAEPGTYLLTDYLVRSFDRTVVRELGLDRYPELRDDYFQHYRQVVWLAQEPSVELRDRAVRAARRLGLPLRIVETGTSGLERALAALFG